METTLTIKTIEDKELWNEASGNNFLQSWEWGEFQQKIGHKIWRIGIYEVSHNGHSEVLDLKSIAQAQLIKTRLRTHIYASNGPVFAEGETDKNIKQYFIQFLGYFKALALKENANFLRFDPLLEDSIENHELLKSLGLIKAGMHVQAETTLLLDLTKSVDDLLAEMKKDTRYEIKRAEKDGVIVEISEKIEDFDRFWKLFIQTTEKQKFIPNSKNYYYEQFKTFQASGKAKMFFAKNSAGKDLATAIIYKQGKVSIYLHAASTSSAGLDLLNAPKLIVWKSVQSAKEEGSEIFDFFGIAKNDSVRDHWYGFTHFKKGFGGYRRDLVSAYDYPVRTPYWFIRALELSRNYWSYPYFKIKGMFRK